MVRSSIRFVRLKIARKFTSETLKFWLGPKNCSSGSGSKPASNGQAFEITSSHVPDDEWDELQDLVQHADTDQMMFDCFTLSESDAVGFKPHGTPCTDEH